LRRNPDRRLSRALTALADRNPPQDPTAADVHARLRAVLAGQLTMPGLHREQSVAASAVPPKTDPTTEEQP
jgi:hypothetical protein